MSENRDIQVSSISKGRTLEEIADYWDSHSLADHWEQTHEVEFDVRAPRRITIDPEIYQRLVAEARTRNVSLEALVNSWLNERCWTRPHNKHQIAVLHRRSSNPRALHII